MKTKEWILVLGLVAGTLGAEPRGVLDVEVEDGTLSRVENRWSPAPGWEGRWWWRSDGPGAAWVRAGGFQLGPLEVSSGTEGLRTWGPSSSGSSGRWGVGWNGGGWGAWAVQDPSTMEAGLQTQWVRGAWALAAGADRTWALGIPWPAIGERVDRGRAGIRVPVPGGTAAGEGCAVLPAAGPAGWTARGRVRTAAGPWSLAVRASGADDPTRAADEGWSVRAEGGWEGWTAGWSGRESDREGRWTGGLEGEGAEARVAWGTLDGWDAEASWTGGWGPWETGGTASVGCGPDGWDWRSEWRIEGPGDRGRWNLSWALSPGTEAPVHRVKAGWNEALWEFEACWKVEGLRPGWFGPRAGFTLDLRIFL